MENNFISDVQPRPTQINRSCESAKPSNPKGTEPTSPKNAIDSFGFAADPARVPKMFVLAQVWSKNNESSDDRQLEYRLFDKDRPERTTYTRKRKGTNPVFVEGKVESESTSKKRRKKNASDDPVGGKDQLQISQNASPADMELVGLYRTYVYV